MNKKYSLWDLIKKKFHRLIVPYFVFGALYVILFYDLHNVGKIVYDICWGGVGHLWYLPMLFWCFLMSWVINRFVKKTAIKLIVVIVMALFSFIPLPFRMTSSMYFFLYFYLGQLCYQHSEKLMNMVTKRRLVVGWIVYLLMFYVLFIIRQNLTEQYLGVAEIYKRVPFLAFINSLHIIYSVFGTLLFYLTAKVYSTKYEVSDWVTKIGGCCFGIYIFQQFILKGIYYHTALPHQIPSLVLPWVGFAVALVISYYLTSLLIKFKFGKHLIG